MVERDPHAACPAQFCAEIWTAQPKKKTATADRITIGQKYRLVKALLSIFTVSVLSPIGSAGAWRAVPVTGGALGGQRSDPGLTILFPRRRFSNTIRDSAAGTQRSLPGLGWVNSLDWRAGVRALTSGPPRNQAEL